MATKGNAPFVSFNGGEIGKEVISRTQIENYGSTAALLENMLAEAAGPMSLRPGFGFLVELNELTYLRKFVFGIDQKYLMAFGDNRLRIVQDGGVIARPSVTSTVGDSSFALNDGSWVEISDVASTATITGGQLNMISDGTSIAGVRQQVTTSSANILHALEIDVARGPVTFKVGSASGLDDYIAKTDLRVGLHSLSFTPTGSYWIEIWTSNNRLSLVNSVAVAAAGDLVLTTPWAIEDFQSLRFQQSKDVLYVSGAGYSKRRIERRSASSWSLVTTDEKDGPFQSPNVDESILMTPSVRSGNGTLTCNQNFFKSTHVGALFKLTQNGQYQSRTITDGDQWSEPIKIQGVDRDRDFSWSIVGAFTGTIRLQRSFEGDDLYLDATNNISDSFKTAPGTFAVDEDSSGSTNNNIVYNYRVGAKTAEFTTGRPTVAIYFDGGSQTGICRVTGYTSPTVVNIEVLEPFASANGTDEWVEGAWSDLNGHPNAIALFDDRLWNGYADQYWASQSSLYETHEGGSEAADAISRSINSGDVGQIQWILPLSRVVIGTDSAEDVIRGSAFDDPITPNNLTVRDISSWGSANVAPTKVDSRGLFVDRSNIHAMELAYNVDIQDYIARPLTRFHKNIGRPGITQISVSRRPETRLFMTKSDGNGLVKLYDPGESVLGWGRLTTPIGQIISVESLPGDAGTGQDEDYFVIKRKINGVDHYYLEQLGNIYYETAADANCLDSYVRVDQDVCNAVTFNGSAYLTRGAALTGGADGKAGTLSFWINIAGSNSAEQTVYASEGGYLVVRRTTTGKWQIEGKNTAGTTILRMTSTGTYDDETNTGWNHVVFAWDLATGAGRLYVNNSSDLAAGSVLTNDTIDYTRTNHAIGATTTGTNKLTGDLAQFYASFAAYLNIAVAANLEKLISSSRAPVELGVTGTGPAGAQPILFFENPAATFGTNIGSGGVFTVAAGYLEDCDSPTPYMAAQSKIVSGLDHLEGQEVYAWVDGIRLGPYTVSSGDVTLPVQPGQACVGLRFSGLYQSSRTAFLTEIGTGQGQQQQFKHIVLILARSTREIEFGADFVTMDPAITNDLDVITDEEGGLVTGISQSLNVPGKMNRDPRLCLRFPGPDPVTLAGYILGMEANARS